MPRRSRCSKKILARRSTQSGRRAAAGDVALVARSERAGPGRVPAGGGHRAALRRCAAVSGAALRAREGLAAGGSDPASRSSGDARIGWRRSKGSRPARETGTARRGPPAAAEGPRPSSSHRRGELVSLGQLAMEAGETDAAIDAFNARVRRRAAASVRPRARRSATSSARRLAEARDALDRVPPSHPGLSDGALQARPGQRAAERAGPRGADRPRPPPRRRDDERVDRAGEVVPVRDVATDSRKCDGVTPYEVQQR